MELADRVKGSVGWPLSFIPYPWSLILHPSSAPLCLALALPRFLPKKFGKAVAFMPMRTTSPN
jgi:hypothetical protein